MNQVQAQSLRASGFTGSLPSMMKQFFSRYGGKGSTYNELEISCLLGNGATSSNPNTAWKQVLSSRGHTGALQDMQHTFWKEDGLLNYSKYVFNGTDSYATMPDWTPLGFPFEVSVEAESRAADFSIEQMAYTSVGTFDTYFSLNNTGNIDWRYIDSSGTQQTKGHLHDPALFETFGVAFLSTAVDIIRISKGVAATTGGTTAPLQNSVGAIGINAALSATHWNGPIWNLRLTDKSPIQNTYVCMGNSSRSRHGIVNNPIVIPENHDFEIEFDARHYAISGVMNYLGDVGQGWKNYIQIPSIYSDGYGDVRAQLGSKVYTFRDVHKLVDKQHFNFRLTRLSGVVNLYLDGKDLGVNDEGGLSAGETQWQSIGSADGSGNISEDTGMQNLRISDLTAGKTWFYPLNEGSGTDIINTHPSTQDADYNGVWTPDTDWQFIPNNSRYYPMNEGAAGGGVFKDVIGGHDATIQNYNSLDWENDNSWGSNVMLLTVRVGDTANGPGNVPWGDGSLTFTLPLNSGNSYNFLIDWGDGSSDTITAWDDPALSHTYALAGDYQIAIDGQCPYIRFNNEGDRYMLKSIDAWGDTGLTSCASMFWGCKNAVCPAPPASNMSAVTSLRQMFRGGNVMNPDVSGFNTSAVSSFDAVFMSCKVAQPAVKFWNTENMTNAVNAFSGATLANPDLSLWNVGKLTDAANMLNNSGITTENYDKLLVGWAAQSPNLQNGVQLGADGVDYTEVAARAVLTEVHGWIIDDGDPI